MKNKALPKDGDLLQSGKAVLFDLDGTLLDTHELILRSMRHAVKEVFGRDFPAEQLMNKVGQPLAVQMLDFTDSLETQQELLRVYRRYNEAHHDELARSFEETEETLQVLESAGYPLGVVTSKRHAPALRGLKLFGLDSYFNFIIGSDDCEKHKPDPGPIIYGAKLIGVEPGVCVYVGDSPYDIQAGNAAGATTVAALWGMFPEAALLAEGPDYLCSSIRDLPTLLYQVK